MEVIEIADYDPSWPARYEEEAARVRRALGQRVLRLEHTGSTSVAGLAAKPVIDMLLAVADAAAEADYMPALEVAGYLLRLREPEWFEHRLLGRAGGGINLHVFTQGAPEIARVLAFRDRLRSNSTDRELYERTKRELAARPWDSVDEYAQAKSAVIGEILARALPG